MFDSHRIYKDMFIDAFVPYILIYVYKDKRNVRCNEFSSESCEHVFE